MLLIHDEYFVYVLSQLLSWELKKSEDIIGALGIKACSYHGYLVSHDATSLRCVFSACVQLSEEYIQLSEAAIILFQVSICQFYLDGSAPPAYTSKAVTRMGRYFHFHLLHGWDPNGSSKSTCLHP